MSSLRIMLFLFLLMIPLAAYGAEKSESTDDAIRVTSDRLEADETARTVVFTGNVKARQSDMVIYADKMTLYSSENDNEQVDRIEIDGELRIVQAGTIATADHGVFMSRDGHVLLSGNAEVHQGGNRITGDEIIYYINESRSIVKSQPDSRVNAVFRPGGGE